MIASRHDAAKLGRQRYGTALNTVNECRVCGKSFDSREEVTKHMVSEHKENADEKKCEICGKEAKLAKVKTEQGWQNICAKCFFGTGTIKTG